MLSHICSQLCEGDRAGIKRQHAEFIKGRLDHKNRKPKHLCKLSWVLVGQPRAPCYPLFVVFASSVCTMNICCFIVREKMPAGVKRMAAKEEELARPDGVPYLDCRGTWTSRGCGGGAGRCLDPTASVEMALQREAPKQQVSLWTLKSHRLSNPSSASFEQLSLIHI